MHKTFTRKHRSTFPRAPFTPGEIQLEIANDSISLRSLHGRGISHSLPLLGAFKERIARYSDRLVHAPCAAVERTAQPGACKIGERTHSGDGGGSGRSFMYGDFFPDDKIATSARPLSRLVWPRTFIAEHSHRPSL